MVIADIVPRQNWLIPYDMSLCVILRLLNGQSSASPIGAAELLNDRSRKKAVNDVHNTVYLSHPGNKEVSQATWSASSRQVKQGRLDARETMVIQQQHLTAKFRTDLRLYWRTRRRGRGAPWAQACMEGPGMAGVVANRTRRTQTQTRTQAGAQRRTR